ncbi:MAG: VOC family protein [Porticoccaceae bacterium]|nr:VOC family protein [Porticoccaceae bacterium]
MFSHIMLGANDIQESKAFYDATLGVLGYRSGFIDPMGRCFYISEDDIFGLSVPIDGQSASHGNGTTIGFSVDGQDAADAWHAAGLANGGTTCENPPGVREASPNNMYLAYLRDPAGNKLCALYRMPK